MGLQTIIGKGRDGWKAETNIELDAPFVLRVSTYKGSRGLVTHATRYKAEGGMISFEMFGDFSKGISLTGERCTEKNVLAQHTAALVNIDVIKAECAAFYAAKEAKSA